MPRRSATLVLLLAALGGAPRPAAAVQDGPHQTTALADAYLAAWFRFSPTTATYFGVPGARHDLLDDNSLAALRAWRSRVDSLWTVLQTVDTASLEGRPEWITYVFLREALESDRVTRVCRQELWPVNQGSGWQSFLADLAAMQPVGTASLRQGAIARARAVPGYLKVEIANLREGIRQGYTTPRPAAGRVLTQIDALLASSPDSSVFLDPARRDSAPGFRDSLVAIVRRDLYPAMRTYRAFLAREYLPKARRSLGVGALPEGRACYQGQVRAATSLGWSGEEVHRRGVERAAEIKRQMESIAAASFHTRDLSGLYRQLDTEPANLFHSAPEIMDSVRAVMARGRAAAPRWFKTLPTTPVVAEPVPEFKGGDVSASYEAAPDDRSRPARYRVQLHDPRHQRRAEVLVTALHETIPGHHLQIALAQELPKPHPIARYLSTGAFTEGWAKYAEQLADTMGLYGTPAERMQLLRSQLPVGMIVDPAIHVLGWSRKQAIDYMVRELYSDTAFAEMYADRMSVWPAQAVTYGTGNLFIRQLRRDAMAALGPVFDIRGFHDAVLRNGAVPLSALEAEIRRWKRSVSSSSSP